jgi:predicted DNA-binding transcriptional regulator AlpA
MAESTAETVVLLDDKTTLATLLNTSVRNIDRLNSGGRLPAPMRLGSRPRWRREEILAWVRAGCPPRRAWEMHYKAGKSWAPQPG